MPSGLSAEELFVRGEEISYDDITILDTRFSDIGKKDVSLKTSLGKGIELALPIMASPMDSVVGPEMAVAVAQIGGIAVIHYNHKDANGHPSVDRQIEEIRRVKRSQNGFIESPITVSPEMSIYQAMERGQQHDSVGGTIRTFPVTEDGESNGILVGLLRADDYFRGSRLDCLVKERLLGMDELVTGDDGMSLEEAREMLWKHHIKSLPITDKDGKLTYLVTRGDIEKMEQFPDASVDERGRLRVLFAVSTWPDSYERLEKGFAAGADGVVVDTSQGYGRHPSEMLKYIAKEYPGKLLIGGNISTAEAAEALAKLEFVDAYRCGQASGSICTTADAIGIGRASATAVHECTRAIREISDMVAIADGGIRNAGDAFKALSFGAGAVMLGGMLAGYKECPGDVVIDETGRTMKEYWGMGSRRAKVGGDIRLRDYGGHEEGIATKVPYKGELHQSFSPVIDALLHSFEVTNHKNITKLHDAVNKGICRFGRRSVASLIESKPSD